MKLSKYIVTFHNLLHLVGLLKVGRFAKRFWNGSQRIQNLSLDGVVVVKCGWKEKISSICRKFSSFFLKHFIWV